MHIKHDNRNFEIRIMNEFNKKLFFAWDIKLYCCEYKNLTGSYLFIY